MSKTANPQTEYAMLTRLLLSLTILGLIISIPVYKYKRTQERKAADTHQRIQTLQKEIDSLSNESKAEMQKKLNELQQQGEIIKGKDQEIEQLKKDLQAKRENQKRIAEEQAKAKQVAQTLVPASQGCEFFLSAAGINDNNARILLSKENASCDPQRWNMAGSSACGIAQELPCGKSGCGIPPNADGLCQIKWMERYVVQRYGGWAAAVAFHIRHNWY